MCPLGPTWLAPYFASFYVPVWSYMVPGPSVSPWNIEGPKLRVLQYACKVLHGARVPYCAHGTCKDPNLRSYNMPVRSYMVPRSFIVPMEQGPKLRVLQYALKVLHGAQVLYCAHGTLEDPNLGSYNMLFRS